MPTNSRSELGNNARENPRGGQSSRIVLIYTHTRVDVFFGVSNIYMCTALMKSPGRYETRARESERERQILTHMYRLSISRLEGQPSAADTASASNKLRGVFSRMFFYCVCVSSVFLV